MNFLELNETQKLRLYKLILKNTLLKKIVWEYNIMYTAKQGREKFLLYKGDLMAVSVQNKYNYAHILLNKEQYNLLFGIIGGKNLKLESQVKALHDSELAIEYFEENNNE